MRTLLICLLLIFSSTSWSDEDKEWLSQINAINQNLLKNNLEADDSLIRISDNQPHLNETIEWLKSQLQERKQEFIGRDKSHEDASIVNRAKGKCYSQLNHQELDIESYPIMIFMSFSVPDHVWLSLSQAMEKVGGYFVIRGLPNNSFKELANQILKLRELGVHADIQIHPQLFQQYNVEVVPAFVIVEDNHFDKITGNISLEFALNRLAEKGSTQGAKNLKEKLRGVSL